MNSSALKETTNGALALLTVTELAAQLGVTARAIRFYEAKGLLTPSRAGTTRVYAHRDAVRMKLILRGKRLGFTLRDIKAFLDLYDADPTQRTQMQSLLEVVRRRRAELEEQRVALTQTLLELGELEQQAMDTLRDPPKRRRGAAEAMQMTDQTARDFAARLLPDALAQSVRDYGHRPALEFLGRVISYRGLGRAVNAAAKGLQDIGVTPGVKVGLCLPNTPYSVILYYAVLQIGGVVVNYNPLYTARELENQVRDSETSMMVVVDMPDFQGKVTELAERTGLITKIIVCALADVMGPMKGLLYRLAKRDMIAPLPAGGLHIAYRDLVRARGKPIPVALNTDDIAVLQYTGGTTGVPKGVMLTHGNVAANATQTLTVMAHMQFGQERLVAVLPLFHVFAMTSVMNCGILSASEILLMPRFELRALLKLIHDRRATIMHAVPTIFGAINAVAAEHGADLSSMKYCISGGAPLPAEVADTFRRFTGAALVEGYGLSETSPVLSCNPVESGGKPGSVGLPLPGTTIEIRDLSDQTRVLDIGEKGEVCVRGPQVMAGYWNRPEDTAEVFLDGALRTGDVGYIDADGYLFLVDRIKDMIIASGFKVYPRVIEEALYRNPAVREAIVVGVPDDYRGQAPLAYVSLQPGADATPDSLKADLAGQISKIEMPREIRIRPELPKTAIGKPSKKDLIIQEGLGLAPSVSAGAG